MTPHIQAKKEEIARTVLMPGDPLRAKYIAENFIENAKLVSSVRNIYAYTGTYKNKRITVMASGMGMPSMGIYSYELYNFYDVENIIRIGTAGAYESNLNILDIILVEEAYSKSVYAKILDGTLEDTISANEDLNKTIIEVAKEKNIRLKSGKVLCSDVFYSGNNAYEAPKENNCLAVEMESFALFANAKSLNKKASCILTVSDIIGNRQKELTAKERQNSLEQMVLLALESGIRI